MSKAYSIMCQRKDEPAYELCQLPKCADRRTAELFAKEIKEVLVDLGSTKRVPKVFIKPLSD